MSDTSYNYYNIPTDLVPQNKKNIFLLISLTLCCGGSGKGLFTVKGDQGNVARGVPRRFLQLLRTEESLDEKLKKGSTQRKVIKVSRRQRSYQKAQLVAKELEKAVSICSYIFW
jgi:hypothetical protein